MAAGVDARADDAAADEVHVALNDAAIVRGALARVVRLELSVDETHVGTYICDGIVVSSPTGSTGYANSAGGPIVDPTARNLIVTPIAAYLAAIRSIVVSPRHTVTVRVIDAHDCEVSIDGQEDIPLGARRRCPGARPRAADPRRRAGGRAAVLGPPPAQGAAAARSG